MRPIVQTLVNGQTLQIPLDTYLAPFAVEIDVVVTGTITYTVSASNDNPWSGSAPTSLIAITGMAAATTSQQASLGPAPIRQLYVQVTAGTGSIQVRVIQSGQLG